MHPHFVFVTQLFSETTQLHETNVGCSELPEMRPKSDSYRSQNSFLRGDWPNDGIICPTGTAASPLKWGKMQLHMGMWKEHVESFNLC